MRPADRASAAGLLVERFRQHILESAFFPPRARILVAVSGGLDSIALLHLLRFRAGGIELVAAHFDHAMRPASSDDAAWVRGVCRAWGIDLVEERAKRPLRSENEARAARYAFLEGVADDVGADRIATAHHADDQVETVLFRIMRGTGTRGLAGIPARRGRIVRPLLPFGRADIAGYARHFGLEWRTDPTNTDRRFARNRIRHDVLPALEAEMPGARDSILRLARCAEGMERAIGPMTDALLRDVIVERSDDAISLARSPLLGYHRLIRGRILRRAFELLGRAPGRAGTLAALSFITTGASGRSLLLSGGYRIEREFDRFVLRSAPVGEAFDRPLVIREPGSGQGDVTIGGRSLRVRWDHGQCSGENGVPFDPAFLRFPLELRGWKPGDRIRLHRGTRKLKKLFVEKRVPKSARMRLPVLADAGGTIVWVDGVGRATGAVPVNEGPVFLIRVTDGDDG